MFKNPYSVKPNELQPGDRLAFVVVAVVGDVGDWSAYALPVTEEPSQYSGNSIRDYPNPEYVATNGDKIDSNAAKLLFTACYNLEWRR